MDAAGGPKALRNFLHACRSDWGPRDLLAAQRKLSRIGVRCTTDLMLLVEKGSLNAELEAAGEKRFTPETLQLMRVHAGGDCHPSDASDHSDPEAECAALERDICRSLDLLGELAASSRRHNAEELRDLAYTEVGMKRLSNKLAAERRRRTLQSGNFNSHSGFARDQSSKRNAQMQRGFDSDGDAVGSSSHIEHGTREKHERTLPRECPRVGGSNSHIGSHPSARTSCNSNSQAKTDLPEPRRCVRTEQSGFTFGGMSPGPTSTADRESRNRRKPSNAGNRDATAPNKVDGVHSKVKEELEAMTGHSDADKRAHVKRLMFRWHPDRNPDNIEQSTMVFQYIQEAKCSLLGLD